MNLGTTKILLAPPSVVLFRICTAIMVEAIKHTYILEEYQGYGGPDQGVLDMKGVKVMLNIILRFL